MSNLIQRLRKQRYAHEVGEPCAHWIDAVEAADEIARLRAQITDSVIVAPHNWHTINLCIASAWLHGSISGGRVRELCRSLGIKHDEIDSIRAAEAWDIA